MEEKEEQFSGEMIGYSEEGLTIYLNVPDYTISELKQRLDRIKDYFRELCGADHTFTIKRIGEDNWLWLQTTIPEMELTELRHCIEVLQKEQKEGEA